MSHLDSTAPEDAGTPGGPVGRGSKRFVLVGLALALVVATVAFFTMRGAGDEPEGADCISEVITLTTAPVMEDLVHQAVKDVNADEPCIDIQVTAGTVKDVVSLLGDPSAELPDIWIPDSPTWKGQLTSAGWAGTPIAAVLAQTPVGLIGGPAAEAPASWVAALGSGSLAMADPSAEGASALALLAPYAEMKRTGETPESIDQKTVPVAQTYGERAVAGSVNETDLSTITASSTQLVPATEHDYLAARRSNDQLALVAPKTGVPMLQFPLIDVNRGSKDMLSSGGDLSARVGRALGRWFASSAGVEAISAAELRGPDGAPLPNDIGLGKARVLGKVPQQTTDDVLRGWRVLSVPSSILAVVDLSGSMKTAIGDTTRIRLAMTASKVALDAFPSQARIGIWGFSKNRGKGGASWAEYAPLERLDAPADGGRTHGDVVRAEADLLPSRVRGGTGVMDTTLAAYKHAQEKWDPAWFNSVVIMTDGARDDSSSLSLESLVNQLTSLRDPAKPVKVVIIGISPDADTGELEEIAAATGGQNYLVEDPNQILGVLAQALLNR
ncbi:substrate-binding domain-containing protein [Nocardioides sp. zg-1228]|uniref:substrate-binding domain-containing protein n=1 Tax=Nocardioides sp. zg-1228 TaxID=2763008 RepID=UPI0016431271|nr:substrate-binding domain-containing protein [Nocardioides sp. zg-1228]MBC2933758.1 substrate-binding domain-containing protein [Nocardioides sp. zg-1228]QSF58534.1 substrate-binding domain-containing protein [Nocardioides sp. zg-1228]